MAFDLVTDIVLVVLVVVMIVVAWLELRYLRNKSRSRRSRDARRPDELQDEAHNALITTRAIASTMAERGGVRSDEVDSMLQEAQLAYNRRNYRVAVDLTSKAKDRLAALRGAQASHGDLAKLNSLPSTPESEEPTTKEVLQKQFPPNLVPSRFAISVAESSIQEATSAGRDVSAAQSLLTAARARFDAEDYGGALTMARQAERSAKGGATPSPLPVAPPPPAPVSAPVPATPSKPGTAVVPAEGACPECGAPLKPDDAFCRKCGARAALPNCPNCGASLLADDMFCRKCGARLPR